MSLVRVRYRPPVPREALLPLHGHLDGGTHEASPGLRPGCVGVQPENADVERRLGAGAHFPPFVLRDVPDGPAQPRIAAADRRPGGGIVSGLPEDPSFFVGPRLPPDRRRLRVPGAIDVMVRRRLREDKRTSGDGVIHGTVAVVVDPITDLDSVRMNVGTGVVAVAGNA